MISFFSLQLFFLVSTHTDHFLLRLLPILRLRFAPSKEHSFSSSSHAKISYNSGGSTTNGDNTHNKTSKAAVESGGGGGCGGRKRQANIKNLLRSGAPSGAGAQRWTATGGQGLEPIRDLSLPSLTPHPCFLFPSHACFISRRLRFPFFFVSVIPSFSVPSRRRKREKKRK